MTPVMFEAAEDPLSAMAHHFGRWIEDLQGNPFVRFSRTASWAPALNVYETRAGFVVVVDLAGMPRDQIDVRAEPDRVVIRGNRAAPPPGDEHEPSCVHIMEIDSGPFEREVSLPAPIAVDAIRATYTDGFLWVHLPKQADTTGDLTP